MVWFNNKTSRAHCSAHPSVRMSNAGTFVSLFFSVVTFTRVGRYSDSIRVGQSRDRIPARARFSAPVQSGPGTHPASYTIGTGSFPGIKRPGRDVDHPPSSSAEVKESVKLYLYSTSGPSWPLVGGTLPLLLPYL
jgi:hypothetical protein